MSLLMDLFVALDVVSGLEVSPAFEAHTTFGVFAHLGYVLLDILERGKGAYIC